MGWFDNEDDEIAPEGQPKPIEPSGPPVSAARDPVVRDYLMKKYAQAADTGDVDKAREDADSTSTWMGVAEGLGQMLTAKGVSRGGKGFDPSALRGISQRAQQGVGEAERSRQARMDQVIKEDQIGHLGVERERETDEHGWKESKEAHAGVMREHEVGEAKYNATTGRAQSEEKHKVGIASTKANTTGQNISNSSARLKEAHAGVMREHEVGEAKYNATTGRAQSEEKHEVGIASTKANTTGQNISNSSAGLKLADAKAAGDPKSKTSEGARLLAATRISQMIKQAQSQNDTETVTRLGSYLQFLQDPNTTATQVQEQGLLTDKIDPKHLLGMELKRERLALDQAANNRRDEQFDNKKTEKRQDDSAKAIASLRGTETWKSSEKTISEMPNIRTLLQDAKDNGGQSMAMLGPKIAKAIAGETGMLTDADVVRYVKNPALVPGVMDDIARLTSGQLGDISYENLKRLVDITEETAHFKQKKATEREAELFSRREGVPYEEALHLLDESFKGGLQSAPAPDEETIKQYMTKYPGKSRDQIIKALSKPK